MAVVVAVADDYDAEFAVAAAAATVVDAAAVAVNVAAAVVDGILEPVFPGCASRSADDA